MSNNQLGQARTVYAIDFSRESLNEALRRDRLEQMVSEIIGDEGFSAAMKTKEKVADKLEAIGADGHAIKVRECFVCGDLWEYKSGKRVWYPRLREAKDHRGHAVKVGGCGLPKLCQYHARIETRRRLAKYLPHVIKSAKSHRIQFVTLTLLNRPLGQLAEGLEFAWSSFNKMRMSDEWTATGQLATIETTYSEENGWNLHLHVLVAIPFGRDFSWRRIQERWMAITGATIVDFQRVRGKDGDLARGLVETLKYVSKHEEIASLEDDAFEEWYNAFFGHRTLRSSGIWYGLQNIVLDDEDDNPDADDELIGVFRWVWGPTEGIRVFLILVNNSTDAVGELAGLYRDRRAKAIKTGDPPSRGGQASKKTA